MSRTYLTQKERRGLIWLVIIFIIIFAIGLLRNWYRSSHANHDDHDKILESIESYSEMFNKQDSLLKIEEKRVKSHTKKKSKRSNRSDKALPIIERNPLADTIKVKGGYR